MNNYGTAAKNKQINWHNLFKIIFKEVDNALAALISKEDSGCNLYLKIQLQEDFGHGS